MPHPPRPFSSLCMAALLAVSCTSTEPGNRTRRMESLYQASDYAWVGEFTSGLEGPAVDARGRLFFVNPRHNGSIGMVDADGAFSLFIEHLPKGSTANGIRFNRSGNLFLADYTGHNVLLVDAGTRDVTVHAHEPRMNQPNDIAIARDGTLYASDPNWTASTGKLWKIAPDGATTLLEENMGTTNGIEISPDESTLYVNESVQRRVWAYDLSPTGTISNKRLLVTFGDHGMDGMRCDILGNLYITRHGKGTVVKLSPAGDILEEITLKGQKPSNIAFGGPDGRTAYITLQDRGYIEQFRVSHPGREFRQYP